MARVGAGDLDTGTASLMARGCILRRCNKNGSQTYSIKYRAADGTQIKRAVGRSRREAEQALTTALAKVDRGDVERISRDTFEVASQRWLRRKRPLIEPSTYQDYERHLRLRLLPEFGHLKLRQVTRSRIEDYVTALDQGGQLSRKTINDSLIPLRQILGRAVRDGILTSNLAESPDRDEPLELPYERPIMAPLTREQTRVYLDSAVPGYEPLAELLIGAGVRISEALALEWQDINWDASSVAVTKSFKVGATGTPKGDRPRTVAIDSYLLQVLAHHRMQAGQIAGLVFRHPRTGGPMRRQYVHRFFHQATLQDAGLPRNIRLHDLRHTAATLWLASGQSIYFVQQQLGHRDIQTTIDLYGHPDQAAHRHAAEQAADWWRRAPSEAFSVPPAVPQTYVTTVSGLERPVGTGREHGGGRVS